ncbi:MAG: UDP-N-acetylglucosamine--LPS N-acetylglucosamine transferase [Lapillicoccus sp.]
MATTKPLAAPSGAPTSTPDPDDTPSEGAGPEHVLLVGSSGGHLAQLLVLRTWWEQRNRTWVSFETPDAQSQLVGEDVRWAHFPTTRNLPNLLRNLALAPRVMRAVRPDLVVSTGAGVALPFFIWAKVMGVPTVFIEVYDRVDSRTLTARLCRPITDRFLVQWESQQELYPGSHVIGRLM